MWKLYRSALLSASQQQQWQQLTKKHQLDIDLQTGIAGVQMRPLFGWVLVAEVVTLVWNLSTFELLSATEHQQCQQLTKKHQLNIDLQTQTAGA